MLFSPVSVILQLIRSLETIPTPVFTGFLSVCAISVQAQVKDHLRAIVQDSHSEEAVPFASVQFKNTTIGKLTDSSGAFLFTSMNGLLIHWKSPAWAISLSVYIDKHRKDSISITINMERGTFNEGVGKSKSK